MSEYIVTLRGIRKNIKLSQNSKIFVESKAFHCELIKLTNSTFRLQIDEKIYDISYVKMDNDKICVSLSGFTYDLEVRTVLQDKVTKVIEKTGSLNQLREVKAPMPGMLLKIKKEPGQKIEAGESIMILEAMKMENDIKSPSLGIIKEIFVKENAAVEKGARLFSVE
ncbi:MAG TPA: acetyl-CoA carboxylase biotin carboxyl carrier protein subunit [Ignavibacteriaceae bacterium]|nr:acetyl-CoA carboxylase biotin carboxyl carrier protein subunit [Ignavibacteriaceae bacterium]